MTARKRLLALATGVALLAGVVDAQSTINGAGATFPYRIYSKWFAEYNKLTRHTPDALSSALELILIGRHLERTGDHATNIAEDVFFVVAGEDIRHQMLGS